MSNEVRKAKLAEGEDPTTGSFPCPDCATGRISPWQKKHRYHCDACTREADPVGYLNEVMGYNNDPNW